MHAQKSANEDSRVARITVSTHFISTKPVSRTIPSNVSKFHLVKLSKIETQVLFYSFCWAATLAIAMA